MTATQEAVDRWFLIDCAFDIAFMVDICINFRTGYIERGLFVQVIVPEGVVFRPPTTFSLSAPLSQPALPRNSSVCSVWLVV